MRIRRVGTVTLGVTLVIIGICFLAGLFLPVLPIKLIFGIWPVIFILLGLEVLWGNRKSKEEAFQYDKTAIGLVAILTVFAMFLAIIGNAVQLSLYFQ